MGLSVFVHSLLLFLTLSGVRTVWGDSELRALMDVKSALDPKNMILTSWTSDGDPCGGAFEGVACNEQGKVVNISLQGKGLSGSVPAAVGELKCLSGLFLHYNALTGEIPPEITNLTELADLYLNFNSLSGSITPEIGRMASLQVLQLCYNQLNGSIPTQIGSLKKLTVLALQHNTLTGAIPASLGSLEMLSRLDLSFNQLRGSIPPLLAGISQLKVLDVQNNNLSGIVPSPLKKLNEGFVYKSNLDLCGFGFSSLRNCTSWDNQSTDLPEPGRSPTNSTTKSTSNEMPQAAITPGDCNRPHCSNSSKIQQIAIIGGSIVFIMTLMGVGFTVFRYRRQKQKIGSTYDSSEVRLSIDRAKEFYHKTASPLVSLEYSNGWDPFANGQNCNGFSHDFLQNFRFNLEEIESATQYFSDANLLGKSNFSSVYKGTLRDGSHVAVRSLNVTSCKSEQNEFAKGLKLLTSLRHENLVQLRGFCCSRARGECFLVYDFAPNGNMSRYLDVQDGTREVLNWSTRVSIINGIAKGIGYLHSSQPNKPALVHQSISAERVLIDQRFNPLISNSGLPKLLADDVVFSTLKVSAAMGYLAPEYITTGRFTEKIDVYAFGVIVLQILSGTQRLSSSMRAAAESCKFVDFIDPNLQGRFSESEAANLAKIALVCTHERPDQRPTMEAVIQELGKRNASS
ncbi:LRR receptor kinase BAK1-like [Malania oleifera]|uniref:LRR receptor kinase BAK1-like n=1 Tax=Malania oleifera TaxID=397392 RepID=UPI0025AEA765|nr:LRR receptor kinase BAK1-like [Malania oleifera]